MGMQAIEDYLKAIYALEEENGQAATSALADRLGVAPASATGMVKKLAELGLVVHSPYRGAMLTSEGRRTALEVIRHHRLVERYLADALGLPWDRVHAEAEKWEHVLSEDIEERIDTFLGFPATDPHGSPIPRRDGTVARRERLRLSDASPGDRLTVTEVSDRDEHFLREIGALGLVPGARVRVVVVSGDRIGVRVNGRERVLSRRVADRVFVIAIGVI